MVQINVPCDRPGCDGSVMFAAASDDRRPHHQFGSCDACHAAYTLYGGQMTSLSSPEPAGADRQGRVFAS